MTDNDIIKALECCIKSSHLGECFENKCPMVSEEGCKVGRETLYPYALDLINRQKAENERLQKNNILPSEGFFNLLCGALVYTKTLEEYNKFRRTFKAEVIKEFAERLIEKEEYYNTDDGYEAYVVNAKDIYDLKKEMAGDV